MQIVYVALGDYNSEIGAVRTLDCVNMTVACSTNYACEQIYALTSASEYGMYQFYDDVSLMPTKGG